MKTGLHVFPSYTTAERRTDASIHLVGIIAALTASIWLLGNATGTMVTLSLAVYCAGLIAMLCVSALYNLLPHIPAKEIARRLDHAVIYVMIAGTYTPLAVNRLPGYSGLLVGIFIWLAAAGGIVLALAYPHHYQRLKFAMYLILGWTIVVVIDPLSPTVREATLVLFFAGGVVYSLGACVHLLRRLRFHNAAWHALVLVAASLHFVAIATELVPNSG